MDIAIELLEKLREEFIKNIENDGVAANLLEKITYGSSSYKDASEFSERIGAALAKTFQDNLSSGVLPDGKMYWNIADRVLRPLLEEDYKIVSDAAVLTQESLNKAAELGLKAQKADLNTDRIDGILNKVSSAENYDEVAWVLDEPVKTFSMSVVDDTLKENVEFQGKVGLKPKITRRAERKCCKWCRGLAGVYDYPNVPKEVYQRHENCRCIVDYDPGDGRHQNVHSKKWTTQEERDTIEKRKIIGLLSEDDEIMKGIREEVIPNQKIDKIIDRQQIHRQGTRTYEQRKQDLQNKGQYGPSYITISDEEVLELVQKYSGKGKIRHDGAGRWNSQEVIVTNEKIVGVVVDNRNGNSVQTSVFKIHYSKDGIHIVPDYPSKKR